MSQKGLLCTFTETIILKCLFSLSEDSFTSYIKGVTQHFQNEALGRLTQFMFYLNLLQCLLSGKQALDQ